ncbi:MAG TPA: M67 family metallopeptidase [Thermodesulfovibrionales bacterium]|nr:M67 family metallopeptidase [Thermodesulfovibrionales bacterium]
MLKITIPEKIYDELVAHCRQGYPNEACGILAGRESVISRIYRTTNTEKSPVSYLMDPSEQFRVMKDMRENDLAMVAIFHSHPSSPAEPSGRDVALAFYDDTIYLIVSLMEQEPVVRAFSIREGKIAEVALSVKGEE